MESKQKPILVTGGCGFVGRHLVSALLKRGKDIWIIDDLSTGKHPDAWLGGTVQKQEDGKVEYKVGDSVVTYLNRDLLSFLYTLVLNNQADSLPEFSDVYHLASIVGGRALIDGDPMRVATDLGIDAVFFLWVTRNPERIERILYASSSAAYPTELQGEDGYTKLEEDMIKFDGKTVGQPDMTYGWSKLTGEYLSTLTAKQYGMKVACVRPFSGYGEDQDPSYPIPAIALRVAAKEDPLTVWGTGEQARDFVHIDDCVEAMIVVLDNVHDGRGVNIGTGELNSFNTICRTYAELEGYEPEIKKLLDKPVGVQNRFGDPSLIRSFGWEPKISLKEGLKRVLDHAHIRLDNPNAL